MFKDYNIKDYAFALIGALVITAPLVIWIFI